MITLDPSVVEVVDVKRKLLCTLSRVLDAFSVQPVTSGDPWSVCTLSRKQDSMRGAPFSFYQGELVGRTVEIRRPLAGSCIPTEGNATLCVGRSHSMRCFLSSGPLEVKTSALGYFVTKLYSGNSYPEQGASHKPAP